MPRQDAQSKLMSKRWGRTLLAVILLLASYGLVSLAIDSGSLLEYTLGILLGVYGIISAVKTLSSVLNRG